MAKKKRTKKPEGSSPIHKRKATLVIALLASVLAAGAVVSERAGLWTKAPRKNNRVEGSITPAGFDPGSPSTEYVYVGGRLLATEEAPAAGCSYSIAPTSQNFAAGGGPGSVTVTAPTGCSWNAVNNSPTWITMTSGGSGSGNGTVGYTVSPNGGAGRTGSLTIANQTFTVNQSAAGCGFSIAPASASFTSAGGVGGVTVTAGTGCGWTAISNDGWIGVTSGGSGSGNGTVNYSVGTNGTSASRTGTLMIAGQTFTVTQAAPPCSFSISPTSQSFSASGGSGSVNVTAGAGCGWTAAATDGWITINSGSSGTGNGTVSYTVGSNSGAARNGTMTIAGQAFMVSQSASGSGPSAPTNARLLSVTSTTVKIAWDHDGVNIGGFRVERKVGVTGTWSVIASNVAWTARSYADNTVMSGKTYFYRVQAFSGSASSGYSNEVQANTP